MDGLIETSAGPLVSEFRQLLVDHERRYSPDEQYRRLCLLALEREQLVSFAYREDVLGRRLDRCAGDPDVLDLFRYAVNQIWRDEEAHTVYIRGELARDERPARTTKIITEQLAGLLAGWSSALKHHRPRGSAPLRSALIDGLAFGARVVGKLSPDLRAELGYKVFRDYCRYNVDAEATAQLCWLRLIELDDQLGLRRRATFERIAGEEADHRELFALLADSFDERDRLLADITPSTAAERLAAIDDRMVPPRLRPAVPGAHVGVGGTVRVVDRTAEPDKYAAVRDLFDELAPDVEGRSVAIKASWMMGYARADPSSVTDPALVATIVERATVRGASDIILLDGPNVYSELYRGRSVVEVATHFGLDRLGCPVADSNLDVVPLERQAIFGPTAINRAWATADIRVSVTRLRTHPTELVHLTTANAEGLIEDSCRSVFWDRSYDYSAAAVAVAGEAPVTAAIVDAWDDCPDGPFGIMAGPRPKHPGRLYGGADSLAVDLVVLRHSGSMRGADGPIDSPTLRRMIETFGDPRPATVVSGADSPIADWRHPYRSVVTGLLADLSYPVYSWLSRQGALFSPPMDPEFVELNARSALFGLVRRIARRVLGLHPPRSASPR